MRLEESIPGVELDENAADTPNVAWEAPPQIQDDLWSPVVSCGNHRRMILVVERSRAKVDQPDLTVEKHPSLASVAADGVRRRRHGTVVGKRLIRTVDQQDVLGLEISVDQIEIVKDCSR